MQPETTLTVSQDNNLVFGATLREKSTGDPIDLTGATISVKIAATFGGTSISTGSIGSGMTVPTPTNGRFVVDMYLARASYAAGVYAADVTVTQGGQEITRLRINVRVNARNQ